MIKFLKFIIILFIIFIATFIYFTIKNKNSEIKELKIKIENYKNAASPNKITIDSLVYNIEQRDSIIYKIKTKYIEDVEVIKNVSDSAIVDNFNKLVWAE